MPHGQPQNLGVCLVPKIYTWYCSSSTQLVFQRCWVLRSPVGQIQCGQTRAPISCRAFSVGRRNSLGTEAWSAAIIVHAHACFVRLSRASQGQLASVSSKRRCWGVVSEEVFIFIPGKNKRQGYSERFNGENKVFLRVGGVVMRRCLVSKLAALGHDK